MPQNFGPSTSNGQYYPAAIAGQLFHGGNQAAVATALSAGLPTTYTGGLILWNPVASGYNLVLQRIAASFVLAQTNAAAISLGMTIAGTAPTGTLTVVPSQNADPAGSATAVGILYSSASITLPNAPYLARILGTVDTGATTVGTIGPALATELNGAHIVPPGALACFLSSTAGTASSFLGTFSWIELPAPTNPL